MSSMNGLQINICVSGRDEDDDDDDDEEEEEEEEGDDCSNRV